MERKPLAAFYCVYMLRAVNGSIRRNVYIGSTPHPRRRLRQHNGDLGTGGAKHTVRMRPSEMALLVTGFPTKEAALQFEWAWQHPHITRHNTEAERLAIKNDRRASAKASGEDKKPVAGKLRQLLPLLQSTSFARMPLKVRILSAVAHEQWKLVIANNPVHVPVEVTIMDRKQVMEGNADIDVTYQPMRDQIMKSKAILGSGAALQCAVCREPLDPGADLIATCTGTRDCRSTSHLSCLSRHFVGARSTAPVILPRSGKCPGCGTTQAWSDIARDVSLRAHGQPLVEKLLKAPRSAKVTDEDSDIDPEQSDVTSSDAEPTTARNKPGPVRKRKTAKGAALVEKPGPSKPQDKVKSSVRPAVIPDSDTSDWDNVDEVI